MSSIDIGNDLFKASIRQGIITQYDADVVSIDVLSRFRERTTEDGHQCVANESR